MSLRASTSINHLLTICCCLWANNFLTGHLDHRLKGHSYFHSTFAFCCILNASLSISTLISLRSFPIFSLIFCLWSAPRPHLWPSVAIFSAFSPPGKVYYLVHNLQQYLQRISICLSSPVVYMRTSTFDTILCYHIIASHLLAFACSLQVNFSSDTT
jgi:hypothetical protein